MKTPFDRRRFLALTLAGGVVFPVTFLGQETSPSPAAAPSATPKRIPRTADPLPEELVQDFVVCGHSDLEGVRRLLSEHPGLLNATYDWGKGDFEMAIGGAGHMGRRDIAEFLLSQGARADIFVSAMLGHLDVVKGFLTATPALLQSKGPHGISLLRHAQAGGAAAAPVADYLRSLGVR